MWGYCPARGVRRNDGFGIQILIALVLCTGTLRAQNCVAPPPGLVSWWPGNGNANDLLGGNPGTITTQFPGQVLFSEGQVGAAFDFRGANFVEIPSIPLNSFTLEFWLNQRTRSAETNIGSTLVSAEVCGVVDDWGVSLLPDGRLRVQVGDVTIPITSYSSFPTSVSSIPLNAFTHVAVTRNTNNSEIKIYINGVLDSTHVSPHNRVLGTMNPTCDNDLHQNRIGIGNLRRQAVLGGAAQAFDGLIDEVSLYNRTLSVGEVAAIYNAGSGGKCPPASEPQCVQGPSDLVSWWKGDGNADDATGAYNSTFMNGITFTDGRVGQAFDFNGIDSQVTFGNTVGNFDTNNFTVEFWIRTTATRHESVIEKWPACGYASMWGIRIGSVAPWSGPGRLEAEMYSDAAGTDQNAISAGRSINDGLFHHVALVRTGTNLVFYIDGVPDVATNVLSGSISRITNSANLTVGSSVCVGVDGTSPFTGQLDEISVYHRALSALEIQGIYNAGGAGKCAPPLLPARALAHWRFDEADGSIAHDSAGSFNGTLSSSGAAFVPGGISGGALSLSKTNNGWVNMGNVLGLDHTDFSIVAWIKMTPQDKTECSLFISKQEAGWANGYVLEANACVAFAQVGKVWFSDSALPGQEITSTASVNDGSWHQVVAVYETGGNKSIYIDGAPAEASKASLAIVPNAGVFLIGGGDFNGIPLGQFTGLVDDVQVYNYALSSSEVDFLFQNPSQEIPAHDLPPGQWRLTTVAGPGGTTRQDPNIERYTNGTTVTVTAVANDGFGFSGWSGDGRGTNNPISITMNGNKSVTASFREIPARILAVVSPDARQEGSTIDVPITLTSQGEVGGMSFVVHFNPTYLRDPDLEWSSVVGSALNQVGYETPGKVRATFALPATAVPAGTRTIATISFQTRSVPFTLSTDLGLEIVDASKPTGDPITSGSYAQSGSVKILVRRAIGDNNANDRLDIGDASIIQRLLTGIDPVRSWDVTGNDVNANTKLDSGDVIRVLRVVVGLDPEPQLESGISMGSQRLVKSGLQKSGPVPGQIALSLDKSSAQPGELVTLQVRLHGLATSLEGAAATLDYPTNALRLLSSQSQRTGPLVPASALTVWNVAPAQTDYASQSGRVLMAMSSPVVWPTNAGVLAEFVFQVQPGQAAQYRWPIRVSNTEVTASGYDVQSLANTETFYIGRVPIPPKISSTPVGLSANGFSLSLTGESGMSYRLETSSDLATWSPLVTLITGGNGSLSFVDSAATNSPQRFYRAKQQ